MERRIRHVAASYAALSRVWGVSLGTSFSRVYRSAFRFQGLWVWVANMAPNFPKPSTFLHPGLLNPKTLNQDLELGLLTLVLRGA